MIDTFIIQSGDPLDSVIINDDINISEMPVVQLLDLLLEHDNFFEKFKNNCIVHEAILELVDAYSRCQVPPLDELLNATIDEPLDWYPVVNSETFLHTPMLHMKNKYLQLKYVLNQSIHN